jgi:hypothetical protein
VGGAAECKCRMTFPLPSTASQKRPCSAGAAGWPSPGTIALAISMLSGSVGCIKWCGVDRRVHRMVDDCHSAPVGGRAAEMAGLRALARPAHLRSKPLEPLGRCAYPFHVASTAQASSAAGSRRRVLDRGASPQVPNSFRFPGSVGRTRRLPLESPRARGLCSTPG